MAEVMGIVNVTPDSFWKESRVDGAKALEDRVLGMLSAGAAAIDVGACSTRPGSVPATAEEEKARLEWSLPIIAQTCKDVAVSIDTFRPEIIDRCASAWRIDIFNDISGGSESIYKVAAEHGMTYVLTYSQTVSDGADVLTDMTSFFNCRLEMLAKAGVEKVILDPGFGFGKTLEQNWRVLAHLDILAQFGLPVLAGLSRKSMACRLLGIEPQDALPATMAMNTMALQGGAEWLRVHDVPEAVQACRLSAAYFENR